MKKSVLVIVLFLISISLVSSVFAADVAYIIKNTRLVDNNVLDAFDEIGLSVELVKDKDIRTTDFSEYRLIFVGDETFRNKNYISVDKFNSVIMNRNYGTLFGLTDDDGISQLASNAPLNVQLADNGIEQVYDRCCYNSLSLPYYYLANENKASGFQKVAGTYTGNSFDLGDVVSFAPAGIRLQNGKISQGRICFFGIAKTKYWTEEAKELFEECVGLVAFEVECNEDEECGEDGFIGNRFCSGNDVYQDFKEFTCNNPGSFESSCSNETEERLVEECSDLCENGECVSVECHNDEECDDSNERTIDTCYNPGTIDSFCTNEEVNCLNDIDCGLDGFVGSPFCDGLGDDDIWRNKRDYTCLNPGTPSSSCNLEVTQELFQDCPDTCIDGACVDIVCNNDADCDDSNDETIDVCHNPGTVESFCTHENILCSKNSDCGSDRFVDGLFCVGDDIYRDFLSFSCNNPNTENSFCSDNISQEKLFECVYACANGFCVRCNENPDCDDSDSTTEDICWFSGTVDAFCSHEHIECFEDIDCGEDSFVDGLYCSEDDLKQDYRTFSCENAGTPGSYCKNDINSEIIEDCEFGCSEGECIEGVHDVGIIEYSEFINGVRIKNNNNSEMLLDEIPVLNCKGDYEVKFRTKNFGNFIENVSFDSKLLNSSDFVLDTWNPTDKDNLAPGDTTDRSTSTQFDFVSLISGIYRIVVEAIIPVDSDLGDNIAEREIEVICEEECTPEQEVCNGVDDDCDEEIDEGDVCEPPELSCNIKYEQGNQAGGVKVYCGEGEIATGGGWADASIGLGTETDEDASYPFKDGNGEGWYCEDNGSGNEAECYAVCCSSEFIETEIKQEIKPEGSGVSVLCDSSFAVGGGFLDLSNINDDYDNDSPLLDLLGWRCAEDNSGLGSRCYAVCAQEKDNFELSCYREEKIGNQESGVFAECDEGYTLLGGGFNAVEDSGGNNDDQDYNKPVDNSWYCKEDNSGENSRCYATCCKLI